MSDLAKKKVSYDIVHQGNDAVDNRYVANMHVCFFLVCLAVLILTELGIYSKTVLPQMRIGTVIMLGITIAVQILGRVRSIASSGKTKYYIVALTLIETLVFTSVLNFMALLVLCGHRFRCLLPAVPGDRTAVPHVGG